MGLEYQTGKAFYSTRYKTMLAFAEDDIGDTADEWVKRIHPDDAPEVFSTMRPSGATAVEFRMQRQDGSWQWTSGRVWWWSAMPRAYRCA